MIHSLYFSCLLLITSLSVLIASMFPALAQDDGNDPAITIEKQVKMTTVNLDGSYEQIEEHKKLIGQQRGLKTAAQQSFLFNATLERVEVIEAYTEKPDGRKVAVQPDQIKTQQEPRSAAAPMFQDIQYKIVIFPDVAIGDRVYVKIKRIQHTPLFPGHFADFAQPEFVPYKELRLVYDMPASMKLYADNVGFKEAVAAEKDGRIIYEWTYIPRKKKRIEAGSVAYADYGHRIAVSTFADYGAFANAYDARAADKAVPSPKIRELAQKLTKDLSDPKQKAKAIYGWVSQNIRYVAVYIGPGGFVPHAAEAILDNRYGDCKDHVTLLEALLTAIGIDSTPALINYGNAYRLTTTPSLYAFNHVITYVPSLDLFLDSTAQAIEFGYLPSLDMDKSALLTKTGKLVDTPVHQLMRTDRHIQIKITPQGSATFTFGENITGQPAAFSRFNMRNLKPSDRDQIVRVLLRQLQLDGSGVVDIGNVNDVDGAYQNTISGKIENLANFPGPTGLPARTILGGGILNVVTNISAEATRTQPFGCISLELDETTEFELPESVSIVSLPKAANVKSMFFDYRSDYTHTGQKIFVKRFYQSHFPRAVCQAADFQEMKPLLDQMTKDLRSQIIVQRD